MADFAYYFGFLSLLRSLSGDFLAFGDGLSITFFFGDCLGLTFFFDDGLDISFFLGLLNLATDS